MPTIPTWSYSRLTVFEQCPLRAKLAYIDRIPEPERPLPPGKTEHANDRGTRIHDAAEMFVKGNIELIPELAKFEEEFLHLRKLFRAGKVSLEGEWALDIDWLPTAWSSNKTWGRMKLDAMVRLSRTEAVVIDYKSGKKWGNEIKHAEQGQLYQLNTFLRYPELQTIHVEFWYTDLDDITKITYSKTQGLKFFQNFNRRAMEMTNCEDFSAKPNMFNCKWCPYKGTHCEKGVP